MNDMPIIVVGKLTSQVQEYKEAASATATARFISKNKSNSNL